MLHPAIEKRNTGSIHGFGLFAAEDISAGTRIWQLDEPIYSWDEIQTWPEDRFTRFRRYGFQCGVDQFSLPEGLSREANHSCDPNTWWSVDDVIMTSVARRDIQRDEEITYDYATCDIDLIFDIECHCGTALCRGRITNLDHLNPDWQVRYGEHLPPHVLAAINGVKEGSSD